jgi:SEC-C motif-containing protein
MANPPTAEALMRSRYVAYTRGDIDYIARTTAPESRAGFDAPSARAWSAEATWLGLQILATDKGGAGDIAGAVEFVATYRRNGDTIAHRELSRFRKTESGEWRFVDGDVRSLKAPEDRVHPAPNEKPPTFADRPQKVGRNDPCACGSGKKFKKCCGAAASSTIGAPC